jgi:hypothetical protein
MFKTKIIFILLGLSLFTGQASASIEEVQARIGEILRTYQIQPSKGRNEAAALLTRTVRRIVDPEKQKKIDQAIATYSDRYNISPKLVL